MSTGNVISPDAGQVGWQYSATEQATGLTWTDGKPVYQVALPFSGVGNASGGVAYNFGTFTDWETVVKIDVVYENASAFLGGEDTNSTGIIRIQWNKTSGSLDMVTTVAPNPNEGHVLVQYTKV